MHGSLSIEPVKNNRILSEAARILSALALSFSALLVLIRQLRIPWDIHAPFSGTFTQGIVYAWNRAGETLGNTNFILIKRTSDNATGCGFFLFIVFLVFAAAAYFIIKGRMTPMLLIYTVPQLLLAVFASLYPDTKAAAALCLAVLASVLVIKTDGSFFRTISITAVMALCILLLAGITNVSGKGLSALTASASNAEKIKESIADAWFGTDVLHRGDCSQRTRNTGTGEALFVTMTEPESLYLKGFTGSRFNGKEWTDLTDTAYYSALNLIGTLELEGFEPYAQLSLAAKIVDGKTGSNEITVKNTGADTRYAYIPYEISSAGDLTDSVPKGGTDFQKGKFGKFKNYTYTSGENRTAGWTDTAARFFTSAIQYGNSEGDIYDFLRLESYFNEFVYNNYTYVSSADRKVLQEYIGSPGDQSQGHADYKDAINQIRSYLEENFIYTENLGERTGASSNELREFFESHKGYDVHFATAATLLFRYFGIPARYVEGYLITPEDAANSDGAISVSKERAHAWTEIYIDGIGFVPIEVTPEFYGVMEEADMQTGISNEALVRNYQDLFGNQGSQDQEEEEETEPEEEKAGTPFLLILLLIILAVICAVLLYFFIRWLRAWISAVTARKKLFNGPDTKLAVAGIYGYMEETGLPRNEEVTELGNRAAYSPEPITEEERQKMLTELAAAKKQKETRNSSSGD